MSPLGELWPIDHIGIAVSDLDLAIGWYTHHTGAVVGVRERLESQGVELVFLHTGEGACIELLAPLRSDSTLAKFITQRGPGLHHLCYRVTDIEHELRRLAARGLRLIDSTPRAAGLPSQAFDGAKYGSVDDITLSTGSVSGIALRGASTW